MSRNDKPEKSKSLESWIWDAACSIRGAKDAPKNKDYILCVNFTKSLCAVFAKTHEDTVTFVSEDFCKKSYRRSGASDKSEDNINAFCTAPSNAKVPTVTQSRIGQIGS